MKLLVIDTCSAQGSVAIADTGQAPHIVATAVLPGRSASELLIMEIRRLATESRTALADLDAVAIVSGPGSFTGVRVGLSAAKGLCEALDVPLIALSRLAVLVSLTPTANEDGVLAVLDAGRGEFYCGQYSRGVCGGEALVTVEALRSLVGSGPHARRIVICEEAVSQTLASMSLEIVDQPNASAAVPLAVERFGRGAFDDAALIDANYLRQTDKEIFAKMQASSKAAVQGG